jgi:[acyl-carrier-protein] S-malonyltransferase
MGKDLAAAFPIAKAVFGEVDAALGFDLSRLCFDGPADELTVTRNAQPALFAHSAAVWALTGKALTPHVRAAAGHSLGECTAYFAANAISLAGGAKLVRRRGELMYEAGLARPGTMAAILGHTATPMEDLCSQATREAGLVVPANFNTDEQVVISGEVAGVDRAIELAKGAGAKRAMKLQVSGAFHSPLMEPAVVGFMDVVATSAFTDATFPVFSNVTATASTEVSDTRNRLVRQLTAPVRWATELRNIAAAYPNALYIEMGPGTVLSKLMGRLVPGARHVNVGNVMEVEKVLQMVA